MTTPRPDADTLAQLAQFAKETGRYWKGELMEQYWARGLPVPKFNKLYGLRNSHGPSWLNSFRLPKA